MKKDICPCCAQNSATCTGPLNPTQSTYFGKDKFHTGSGLINGNIDEARISNIARSADWLKATYLTQMDQLISFGTSESIGTPATFVYDGDGNRVKKTDNGETIVYVNQYYEKNLTTGNVTTRYYSGGRLIAEREATTLRYFHQDSLSSTSLMSDASGNSLGTVKYLPFGAAREGSVPTDIQFTGQRLDDTGLYYYGARYYDSNIGRFMSPDTLIQNPNDPQSLNRYAYVRNNPLKLIDPTGLYWEWSDESMMDIWYEDDYVPPAALTASELRAVCDRGSFVPGEPQLPLETKDNPLNTVLNVVQTVLDLAGLIPGAGEPLDLANAAIYTARGDYVNAGLSAAAAIPFVGWVGTGAKFAGKIDDAADVVKAGWHVGDPITNLTAKGTEPSWDALRQRIWKNEAFYNPSKYNVDDVSRMHKGLPRQELNTMTGKMESLQLHHPNGRQGAAFYQVQPVTRSQHIQIHRGK